MRTSTQPRPRNRARLPRSLRLENRSPPLSPRRNRRRNPRRPTRATDSIFHAQISNRRSLLNLTFVAARLEARNALVVRLVVEQRSVRGPVGVATIRRAAL